jgi:molecular chaperone GrpE
MNEGDDPMDNPEKTPQDGPVPNGQAQGVDTASQSPPADELAEARRQRDDYFDQLQRSRAEFVNYQKRAKAQADIDRAYAIGGLAADLLPVLDNFERAAEAARSAGAPTIVEGIDMVARQLMAALAKHGVEPIAALGQPFDPNRHEALVQQPDAQHPEGTVVAELGKGYMLRDRVLRPAKVAVSVKPT